MINQLISLYSELLKYSATVFKNILPLNIQDSQYLINIQQYLIKNQSRRYPVIIQLYKNISANSNVYDEDLAWEILILYILHQYMSYMREEIPIWTKQSMPVIQSIADLYNEVINVSPAIYDLPCKSLISNTASIVPPVCEFTQYPNLYIIWTEEGFDILEEKYPDIILEELCIYRGSLSFNNYCPPYFINIIKNELENTYNNSFVFSYCILPFFSKFPYVQPTYIYTITDKYIIYNKIKQRYEFNISEEDMSIIKAEAEEEYNIFINLQQNISISLEDYIQDKIKDLEEYIILPSDMEYAIQKSVKFVQSLRNLSGPTFFQRFRKKYITTIKNLIIR